MQSYDIDPTQTGWLPIDGKTSRVVAFFKDGHSKEMSFLDFVCLPKKVQRKIIHIDCYTEDE